MSTPVLFVDRDGTIVEEPADFQLDSFAKLRFVDGALAGLARFARAGWDLVMISNQDGLGTDAFPTADFEGPQNLILQTLASEGVTFREILIDPSLPADNCPNRKPGIGLAQHLLKDRGIDWERSIVVGDRDTDQGFADNLGVTGYRLASPQLPGGEWTWAAIAHEVLDAPRRAQVVRATNETTISVAIDLDSEAPAKVNTGVGFFDHMLDQLGRHGGFFLEVKADGDLWIDEHHTVEDTGLAIGQCLKQALGDKRGIARYGFTLPMDECLAQAALDFGGRPYLVFDCPFTRERVGELPTEMVEHFWRSLCEAAAMNLNLVVTGDNDHHKIEAGFKAVARALRMAKQRTGSDALPTTKGTL